MASLSLGLTLLGACQPGRTDEPLVRARTIPLEEDAPDRTRLGSLRYEAGFVLNSDDPRFGGLSGMWLAPDGQTLMMASDRGALWRARLEHDGDRLAGFADWSVVDLGRVAGNPSRIDAEALAADADGLLVAVEGREPLRRVPRDDPGAPATALPVSARLTEAGASSGNVGIEALSVLPDGALLALAEGVEVAPGELAAWRIEGDRLETLRYVQTDRFVPTGADRLDDILYVVERRFALLDGGFASRLVALDLEQIRQGEALVGHQLARLGRPAISENFEGIGVRRGADGRVLLYLVSDDNFLPFQQTLLLQFSLDEPENP
jgi:hypothetical protein